MPLGSFGLVSFAPVGHAAVVGRVLHPHGLGHAQHILRGHDREQSIGEDDGQVSFDLPSSTCRCASASGGACAAGFRFSARVELHALRIFPDKEVGRLIVERGVAIRARS